MRAAWASSAIIHWMPDTPPSAIRLPVALYSNGGSRTLATWRTDSASGQSFTLEYDASLMASLRLKFNYEGTGLWYWALQNS